MRLPFAMSVVLALAGWGCHPSENDSAPPLSRLVAAPSPLASASASPLASHAPAQSTESAQAPAPIVVFGIKEEAWIHALPSDESRRLGYVSPAGRVASPTGRRQAGPGCQGGWLQLARGHICSDDVTRDPKHAVVQLFKKPPRRDGLPYLYARSRYPSPMRYSRLPTVEEQRDMEPDLRKHARAHQRRVKKGKVSYPTAELLPSLLAAGGTLPSLGGPSREGVLALGRAKRRSGFALLGTYEHEGRRFGLTRELSLIALDRTNLVQPSALVGAQLDDDHPLPIAIVTSKRARRHRLRGSKVGRTADRISRYTVVALTGEQRTQGSRVYLEARDGRWVRANQVIRIDRFRQAPVWAKRGDKWIDISILNQTLVAYEGDKAVFATVVSTGAGGIAGHVGTHATIRGTYLIHTKHLSTKMDSDVKGESFSLSDVPFVQYFTAGYALHGAYWHDDFGRPRSHGCVNLSPRDAAWLFAWTGPSLPEGWHGALSEKSGTLVHIHP